MNKIYKLIWSQTANAFVAVSELATARDKSSSTTNNAALGAWVAVSEITKSKGKKSNKAIKSGVLVSSLVLFAGNAIAASYDAGGGTATGQDSVAIGSGAASQGLGSVAMGANSEAIGINSTAIGPGAKTAADDALAIGRMAQAIGRYSTAVGDQAKANKEFSNAFGYRATANAVRSTAIGMNSSTSGDDSVSIGNSSSVSGNWSAALGQEASVQSDWSTAIGFKANAKGTGSTAIGTWAKTSGVDAAAFGNAAEASGSGSLALGRSAKTDSMADQALAVGFNASAAGITSNAIGANAKTTARNATAIGSGAKAYSHSGIAMGTNAEAGSVGSEDTLVQAMALGANSKAKAQSKDVALGEGSETSTVANTKNTQIDGKTYTYAGTNAKSTLSVGKSGAERTITNVAAGRISGTSTDAINGSQLYGTNQAINSLADDVDTLGNTTAAAIGGNSTYNPSNHTVSAPTYNINNQNVSTVSGAINKLNEGWNLTSNGNSTAAVRTNDTVDIGTATGETNLIVAKNGNTIDYSLNKKLDLGATGSVNAGGTVINNNGLSFVDSNGATLANTPSIKKDGINAGGQQIANVKAGTGDTDAVNVSQLKAATTHYYSVNDNGVQRANYNNDGATGINSLAAGTAASATESAATAVGNQATAAARNSVALGNQATANTAWSVAIGNKADATGSSAVAIGNGATTTVGDSVALGAGSKADANGRAVTEATVNGLTFGDFAGSVTHPGKVVSVGAKGEERQIKNVAPGQISNTSTDAINGSQLYATNAKLGNVAKTVVENFGGNATLNPDGSITYTNIGNTGKDNIHDAIQAATTKVEEADGIKVVPTTNADGSTTYTVSAKTDGTTTKIDGNGNIAAVTTTFTPSTDGKVGAPVGNGDSLVTANTVADAINNSGWKATSGATGSGVVDGTTEELINPSETVTFQAGDNMVLNQAGNVFTYSLNKDININSVQFNDGPKITNDGDNIKVGDKDGNATKITNVKAGEADTDAVNVSQLKEAADNLVTTGFNIADGKGGNDNVKLGETVTFADPAGNIITTVTDNKVEFGLNSTLSVGKDGEPGKVGIKGADGKDAISLNGEDGTIGINGKDGANATLTVEKGKPGLDGKDGQTRIVYTKPDGSKEEVATLNDGLNFKADDGSIVPKKLNETLEIVGGADKDSLTDNNIGVNNKDGKLTVQLAKDLKGIDSITVNNGPVISGNGIDMNGDKITNLAPGVDATDAVNVSQLEKAQAAATTKVEEADGIKVVPTKNADGSTTYTVSAKTDGTTTKIDGNGNIAAVTTTFTPSTDGKVGAPVGNGDSLVTANTVADAINNSGWKATSGATGSGVVDGTTEELINPSETVTFQAGDNMVLNQAGNVFTYSLNKDININSVQFNDGPKITNDGDNIKVGDKDGNATKITNVKAGEADTDAVNVSQLKEAADNLVTTGFNIADGKGGNDNVKLGETVTFADPAGNIITTVTDNKVEFGLNSTLSVGKDGEPGKVGIKGADGKDAISLNGEDGTIGINGKDGANATLTVEKGKPGLDGKDGQTRIVYTKPDGSKEEVATLNDGLNFKADDGSIVPKKLNETLEIVGGADKDSLTDNNIGVNNKDGKLTVQLAKDLKGIDSITVNNGPVISGNGIDMNGDKITNLAPGVDATDAVNVSQLEKAQAAATTKVEEADGIKVVPTKNADGSTTYTVSAKTDGTTTKIDGNGNIAAVTTTFTPSTDGKVGAPVGNGDSLVTAKTVADAINNSGWKLAADGTTGTELINPSDTVTFKTGSSNLTVKRDGANITYDLARNINVDSVQIGANGPKITNDGNNIKVGDKDGNATKITNVAPGVDATDAVNVSQLKAVEATANKGWNLTTNGKADSKSNVKPGDTVDFANTDGNVKIENTGNKVTVNLNKDIDLTKDGSVTIGDTKVNNDGLTIVGGPSVTKSGIDAGDKKITNVADGVISATSKDAVNGSQLYQAVNNINTSIAASKEEVKSADGSVTVTTTQNAKGANVYDLSVNTDGTTIKKNADGSLAVNTTPLTNNADGTVKTPTAPNAIATAGDIANAINNSGFTLTAKGSNGSLVKPGATVDMNNTDGNIVISKSASDNNVTYNLAKNVKVDSVTAGDTVMGTDGITINNGSANGNTVSLTKDGLNNGGNRITNVAPGVNGTDAVNVNQLQGLSNNINSRMDGIENNSNAGTAAAMAVAGLPQAYLPGKSMMAVAGGVYRGESGYAIGFSSISDGGNWVIKGTASGNSRGHYGATAGVGYQW